MEQFEHYAQVIGSHTFKAYSSRVVDGPNFTAQLFHMSSSGELKKLTYTGILWKGGELQEEKILTADDFSTDEKKVVLDTLLEELEEKAQRYAKPEVEAVAEESVFPI